LVWPVEDVKAISSDFNVSALALIGAGAGIYALAQTDPGLNRALRDAAPSTDGPLFRAVEEFGNARVVRPAMAMVFLGSLASGNERFQDASFTTLESVVLANLLTNVLKAAFGRSRPYQDEGPSRFNPFSGNTSFPSGHSATAFALVTPWMYYYPSPWTSGLLVLGAGTALSRVASNVHWVSDVVAGSTIGFLTAYVLTHTHIERTESITISPIVTSEGTGVTVAFRP
ncbi:MAG TPA: phosphatase PAP2 family protein, partial [Rhodothermales bacterium]